MTFVAHIKKTIQHKLFQWWGICFIISVALYWRTLFFGFFSDDFHLLHIFSQNNNIFSYFLTNIIGERGGGSYGPVYNALFIFLESVFGMRAMGYHGVMILLHSINGLLVYVFARQLLKEKYIAIFSSLCFLFFQSSVSSVAWVSTLPHVATTACILFSIVSYHFFITTKKGAWYLYALGTYFLALFSKEIAITVPVFVLILDLAFSSRETFFLSVLRFVKRLLPFFIITLVYLVLRRYTTHIVAGYYGSSGLQFDMLASIKHLFEIIIHTIVPSFLRVPFMYRVGFHMGFLVSVAIAAIGLLMYLSKNKKEYAVLIGLYIVASFPFLQVMFHPVNDGNDRYTYLLSSFLSIIIVYSLFLLMQKLRQGRYIAIGILILFFCTQIVFGYAKQRSWVAADAAVTGIIASAAELDTEQAYMIFVGLPDNIDGAEVFRNAIKEGIALSTDRGYPTGERIPLYVALTADSALENIVEVRETDPFTFRFTAVNETRPRLFTGFPTYVSDIGTFTLAEPKFPEHSGTAIDIVLNSEKVRELTREGKKVLLAYYNQGSLQTIAIE